MLNLTGPSGVFQAGAAAGQAVSTIARLVLPFMMILGGNDLVDLTWWSIVKLGVMYLPVLCLSDRLL